MEHEVCSRPCHTFAVRHGIEQLPQLGMIGYVAPDFIQRLAGRRQSLIELHARFDFGFAERHLHAAVGVDLAFA